MHEENRNGKTAEASLKQIASQKFQAKKRKMQIWKQMIIQKVTHKLQIIEELADVQKEHFQKQIEVVKEQL